MHLNREMYSDKDFHPNITRKNGRLPRLRGTYGVREPVFKGGRHSRLVCFKNAVKTSLFESKEGYNGNITCYFTDFQQILWPSGLL